MAMSESQHLVIAPPLERLALADAPTMNRGATHPCACLTRHLACVEAGPPRSYPLMRHHTQHAHRHVRYDPSNPRGRGTVTETADVTMTTLADTLAHRCPPCDEPTRRATLPGRSHLKAHDVMCTHPAERGSSMSADSHVTRHCPTLTSVSPSWPSHPPSPALWTLVPSARADHQDAATRPEDTGQRTVARSDGKAMEPPNRHVRPTCWVGHLCLLVRPS